MENKMGQAIAYNPCFYCNRKEMCHLCELKMLRTGITSTPPKPPCLSKERRYEEMNNEESFYKVMDALKAPDLLTPFTVRIVNCKKIQLHHKEIDVEFELDADKFENIDTIIINGYKYVKKSGEDDG